MKRGYGLKAAIASYAAFVATLIFLTVKTGLAGVSCSVPFNLTNGTTADASQVMANYNAILTCLANNTAASGANGDITALSGLTTPLSLAQGGTSVYLGGTSVGTNTITATAAPINFALTANFKIIFVAGGTNTGATTLNVSGTGAKNVFRITPSGPIALTGGEIQSGQIVEAVYDGTQYQLIDTAANNLVAGPLTNLTSASADLGTIASHNVNITGTTTITAFGSTAVTTYPIYILNFAGALILTHNGTSLILPGAANIVTAIGDSAIALYLGSGNWQVVAYQRAASQPYRRLTPTYQVFTSGSAATYTTAANATWIRVRAVGGGGGGSNGGVGGTTSFNAITAIGGTNGAIHGGASPGQGGIGGTGGAGAATLRVVGTAGLGGVVGSSLGVAAGGAGGNAPYFSGGGQGGNSGIAGAANTGSGGGAGGNGSSTGGEGGGGSGEYYELVIGSPAATYTYTVGAAGTAGTNGAAGAAGRIVVEEYYD